MKVYGHISWVGVRSEAYHIVVGLLLLLLLLLDLSGGGRGCLNSDGCGSSECVRVGEVLLDLKIEIDEFSGRIGT